MYNNANQKRIVIIVMAFILTLAVGYAIFSESLNISGSAGTGSANLNIVFDRVGSITEVEASNTTADIQESGKKLVINVPGLKMPTAYAKIPVTIKNKGDIVAKVKQIRTEGLDTTDIKVTYEGVKQEDVFNPNDEKELIVKVTWDESSTSTSVEATFSIEIDFEQVTSSGGGTTSPSETISDPRYEYNGTKLVRLSQAGVEYYQNPENSVIEIPEGTTEIGDGAFLIPVGYDMSQVPNYPLIEQILNKYILNGLSEEAIDPEDMEKIGIEFGKIETMMSQNTFISSFAGKSLSLPNGLQKVGIAAFDSLQLAGNLNLPSTLVEISAMSFENNKFSGSLVIPTGVTKIGAMAFQSVGFTGDLTIPGTVKEIGLGAFSGPYPPESRNGKLILSDGIEIIGADAFSKYIYQGDLIIPDSVTEIGEGAFGDCEFRGTLKLSNKLTVIRKKSFGLVSGHPNYFTGELYIPDSVTKIEEGAFLGNFSSISIPSGTTYVESGQERSFPEGIQINKR